MFSFRIAWGGSLAFHARVFRHPRALERWSRSFSEDTGTFGLVRTDADDLAVALREHLRVGGRARAQEVDPAEHGRQGRPQLVREQREKLVLQTVGGFRLGAVEHQVAVEAEHGLALQPREGVVAGEGDARPLVGQVGRADVTDREVDVSAEQGIHGRAALVSDVTVFEHFPEHAGTPHEVQLGLLGRELLTRWDGP